MKAIKCEMCGSTQFIKADGMYVCQYCNTKYTVEEAKKLMVEGTVKIDETDKLANLYERARKSIEVGDLKHAAEYYKEILDRKPSDWEAYFYTYLGEYTEFTYAQAPNVAQKLGNTLPAVYKMALSDCDGVEGAKRITTITSQAVARLEGIASCAYSLLSQYEGGSMLTPEGKVNNQMYNNMRPTAQKIVVAVLDALANLETALFAAGAVKEGLDVKVLNQCQLIIRHAKYDIAGHTYKDTLGTTDTMMQDDYIYQCAQRIKELDPSFVMPDPPKPPKDPKKQNKKTLIIVFAIIGAFFVAAAVCGLIIIL